MHDNLPLWFALPTIMLLWTWLIISIYKQEIRNRIDDFFAWRRHVRREKRRKQKEKEAEYAYMRAYVEKDIEAMMSIYNVYPGDQGK